MMINDPETDYDDQPICDVVALEAREAAETAISAAQQALADAVARMEDKTRISRGEREAALAAVTLLFRDEFAKQLDALGLAQVDNAVSVLQDRESMSFNGAIKAIANLAGRSTSGVRFAWGRPRHKKAPGTV